MATSTETLQMILSARDNASGVFSRFGLSVITLNQGLDVMRRLAGAVSSVLTPLINFLKESAIAADEAALAETQLATALRSTGQFSQSYLDILKSISGELQTLTGMSDEAILSVERQLIAFGATREQIIPFTRAVLDLSAGMGTDLQAAVLLLGKALAGDFGTLSRYGILVDEAATNSEKLDQALAQINQRFGGQAEARMQTLGGQIGLLKERFGDLQEGIGGAIVQSDHFQGAINEVGRIILEATNFVTENKDVMRDWIRDGVFIAIDGLRLLMETAVTTSQVLGALVFAVEGLVRPFVGVGIAIRNIFSGDLTAIFKTTDELLGVQTDHLGGAVIKITELGVALDAKLRQVRTAAENAGVGTRAFATDTQEAVTSLAQINSQLQREQQQLGDLAGQQNKQTSMLDSVNNEISRQRELFESGAVSASDYALTMSQLISQQDAFSNSAAAMKEIPSTLQNINGQLQGTLSLVQQINAQGGVKVVQ